MAMRDLKHYLIGYKEEEEEDFNELFKDMDLDKVQYIFHSVAYVINEWHTSEDEKRKYMAIIKLLHLKDI